MRRLFLLTCNMCVINLLTYLLWLCVGAVQLCTYMELGSAGFAKLDSLWQWFTLVLTAQRMSLRAKPTSPVTYENTRLKS